jgi:phosphoribosylamine--glycine ligase
VKVMVVGSGGREHALVWKLSQSTLVDEIYAAPGNGGTGFLATNVEISAEDISGLAGFADSTGIDLTVVGPEVPLVKGIADEFRRRGLSCFGPSQEAARIEGSKVFAKQVMKKYGIPTSEFQIFKDRESAADYVRSADYPVVIKANGLAAGKGVIVAEDVKEAVEIVDMMFVEKRFGDAGSEIVVEEYLKGDEASIIALTDGKEIVPLLPSQDHKPIFDGDRGPNTGGMGAYAPVPKIDDHLLANVEHNVLRPVVAALRREGIPYRGAIYAGLMLTEDGPRVLEFNCRFGDPETQPVLPLLKSDFGELLQATIEGRLGEVRVEWSKRYAVCVVLASHGYPGEYEKGKRIRGVENAEAIADVVVFHAGTKLAGAEFVTAGGRVLGVTAIGETLNDAVEKAYRAAECIEFENVYYRRDVGLKALG